MSQQLRLLTKSRFKLALECPTKLYYVNKKKEFADQNLDDPFLRALAEGGFQVGELAKYYFSEDPQKDNITIDTLDYDKALAETEVKLKESNSIIAEAAFRYNNLFVRCDIVRKRHNVVSIYEVKAKSFDFENEQFLNKKGDKLLSDWSPYLYDIAFQRYVVSGALKDPGVKINAYLILVDKNAIATVDGLNQMFKIFKDDGRTRVQVREGITSKDLGSPILKAINVDSVCDKIQNDFPVPTDLGDNMSFEDFINQCAQLYENDQRKSSIPLGSKCNNKKCQFHTLPPYSSTLKSGFFECWANQTNKSEKELQSIPLVLELWNGRAGSRSFANELVKNNKFFLRDIEEEDIQPKSTQSSPDGGLTSHERRMEQVNRVKNDITESYFDQKGIEREMNNWKFPLHMIDFETSMVALPFHRNINPYEGLAFQFSHHIIDKDWNIIHADQFLSFEPGVFPNYEFVRHLKSALTKDDGSVFRYHNHENNYLNLIYNQLKSNADAPADKEDLMNFIKTITHSSSGNANGWKGDRDMIDLYELVLKYYYSPFAKGSNSLKQILPAIINDSQFLKEKYGKSGIYGKDKTVKSLNFDDHVWIAQHLNFDPYKTLPKVFDEYDNETLDALLGDFEDIADGGAALTAYNYLQYSELPINQRQAIKDALLRYCELDTMAMVMICEAWRNFK